MMLRWHHQKICQPGCCSNLTTQFQTMEVFCEDNFGMLFSKIKLENDQTLAFLQNKRLCSESYINWFNGIIFLRDEPYFSQTLSIFCFNVSCFFNHFLNCWLSSYKLCVSPTGIDLVMTLKIITFNRKVSYAFIYLFFQESAILPRIVIVIQSKILFSNLFAKFAISCSNNERRYHFICLNYNNCSTFQHIGSAKSMADDFLLVDLLIILSWYC